MAHKIILICMMLFTSSFSSTFAAEVPINTNHDIIIVGGGMSGLTAAFFLHDYDVKVLERSAWIGGRDVSNSFTTFSYTSPESTPRSALSKMIDGLDFEILEVPSPIRAYFENDQYFYGSDGLALHLIGESSVGEYNRFVMVVQTVFRQYHRIPNLILTGDLADLDNLTAQQWIDRNNFPTVFAEWLNGLARSHFGSSLEEISALSLIADIGPEFAVVEPVQDIHALENSPEVGRVKTNRWGFADAEQARQKMTDFFGDQIQLNSSVTTIERINEIYIVTYEDAAGQSHTLTSKAVILAVPASIAPRLAPTLFDEEQQDILYQIAYRSYVMVQLTGGEPWFTNAMDVSFPKGARFTDIYDDTWMTRFYNSTSVTDTYSWTIFVSPYNQAETELLDADDEGIMIQVYGDLETFFPDFDRNATEYSVERISNVDPIMTVGSYSRLLRLHEITNGGCILSGDFTVFPDFEGMIDSGYLAAQKTIRFLDSFSGFECSENYK